MLGILQKRRAGSVKLWKELTGVEEGQRLIRPRRPFLFAGTNVVTDHSTTLEVAKSIKSVCEEVGLPMVFKASWDKANRTAPGAYRGLGMSKGLSILQQVKEELGVPIVTDVHETSQVSAVAQVADVIQVPSFLCRQTDLIEAVARSGRIVHLKRGQFASPTVMGQAVQKCKQSGNDLVMVCERGLMFGMDDLVFDPRQVAQLANVCGPTVPVLVDVTHACQKPPFGGQLESSGSSEMVPLVARCAAASGVDGIFIECHPTPQLAPVDGALQLDLEKLKPLLEDVVAIADILAKSKV